MIKEKDVETISKSPIMKCTIKNVETCPYSYNVEFKPVQEKVEDKIILLFRFLSGANMALI